MVFENETQPDARRASESTTFKLRACLRWRRMPTLTVACSGALKLAGAEGSELVSLGSCSPVKPPSPLVALAANPAMHECSGHSHAHGSDDSRLADPRQHIPDDTVRFLRPSASKGSRCSRGVAGSRERLRCPESIAGLESIALAGLG